MIWLNAEEETYWFPDDIDKADFIVEPCVLTEKDSEEISRGIAENKALRTALAAQGYSPAEIHERINARFRDSETAEPVSLMAACG